MGLRLAGREIFDQVLRAVDAADATRRLLRCDESRLYIGDLAIHLTGQKIYSIAIGKAAQAMAFALEEKAGEFLAEGLIAAPPGAVEVAATRAKLSAHWRRCEGGHPLPNEGSMLAAAQAFALLERANKQRAPVIFLISGGGSALIEWPVNDEITLAELRAANRVLVTCGASISEINSVRRAFSAVKGGKLAERAPDCDQITLIVSDVPADEEYNVASGPSLTSNDLLPDAREVIEDYHLRSRLPAAILTAIDAPRRDYIASSSVRRHFVLLNNIDALNAAAAAAGQRAFVAEIATEISDQPIIDGCEQLTDRLNRLRARCPDSSLCLVSGGEFACPVQGDGLGGRNLETALRLALLNQSTGSDFAAVCAGTDGIDGNSPAAGAIVDNTTIQRARAVRLNAEDFLARSDAYSFFVALGDAIATGSTGTNVRDIRILLTRS